jgi:hypothetical protein
MNHMASAFLVPALAIAGLVAAAVAKGQDTRAAPTPGQQYQGLMQEFSQAARGLWEATNDEQRAAVAARVVALTPRVLAWAESNASDPLAQDSLVQVVGQELWLQNNTAYPGRGGESLEDKAVALLLEHHIRSATLGEACKRMAYGFGGACERFLRTVLAESPHQEVQGLACLRLAQFLNGRLRRLDLLSGFPEMATRYQGLFGKDYLGKLERQDRAAAIREIETLFERAAREFGDIKLPWDGAVGATARSELFELRNLSVGQEAPEIEGTDQDGVPFKLSDYRGKVVLLYIWAEH